MSQCKDIWVIIEQAEVGGRSVVKGVSLEALSAARSLANQSGGRVVAVVLCGEAGSIEKSLGGCGADQLRIVTHPSLTDYNPLAFRRGLEALITLSPPFALIMGATNHGKELLPAIATAMNCGCVTDCISMEYSDGGLVVQRPVYSGKAVATLRFAKAPPFFITIRPNLFRGNNEDGGQVEISQEVLDLPDMEPRLKFVERNMESGKRDITEARVVVSGGMGMQGPENFPLLEVLAEVVEGAVGASRPVVDEGWRPYSNQVGQTGRTVSPNLYIACGISGAVQHLAGMSSSQCIVAINKDENAPIFDVADFGIVGDALEIIPVLTEEIRKVTQS